MQIIRYTLARKHNRYCTYLYLKCSVQKIRAFNPEKILIATSIYITLLAFVRAFITFIVLN